MEEAKIDVLPQAHGIKPGGPKGKAKITDFQQREVRANNLINQSSDVDKDRVKRDQEKWKNRRSTCYCKLRELSLYCGAEIYALVCRQGEIYTLNTTDIPSFPPPESTLRGLKGKVEVADFQLREVRKLTGSATSNISRNLNKVKWVKAGKSMPSVKRAIQPPVWVTSPVEMTLSGISAFDPPERLGDDEGRFIGGDTLSVKRAIQPPIWMTSSVEKMLLDPPEHLRDDESQFVESGPCNNIFIPSFDPLYNL
ncbi:hypothetical protein BDBG_06419 [Blastomyces gilchristii SLH14081]|uniref:MADS-box domain-containing protein n=1 Tax=Blastomyces gilchristii (strain SLH14081) TaxID=559298 RepID=A0A179UTU5_BLAGS|nr:uncharacterized protein BDBG_06419 [Blastomyces gilchristii SLH14081]OAT10598.1 hypothetical protein BDBG_06419 [Blastomyces gilchristii SLH14081]